MKKHSETKVRKPRTKVGRETTKVKAEDEQKLECDSLVSSGLQISEQELPLVLEGDDETSLTSAKALWFFGEWAALVDLDIKALTRHPDRDRLALLVGSAHQQLGDHDKAKNYTRLALQWGCPPRIVAQVLTAGVHNTLGRIAALKQDENRIAKHFDAAVEIAGNKKAALVSHARAAREMTRMGLLPQAASLVDKRIKSHSESLCRPMEQQAQLKGLEAEVEILQHELSLAQQRQQLFQHLPDNEISSADPSKPQGIEIKDSLDWSFLEKTKLSRRNPIIPKAAADDFAGRFCEVLADPLNQFILRVPSAGQVDNGWVTLHNGHSVPISGKHAYYDNYSNILVLNRGVHEPLEEFCFQEIIKKLREKPVMLELGSFWAHYSMWLKQVRPEADLHMVEPELDNIEAGKINFEKNGYSGTFVQEFVGHNGFKVDEYQENNNITKIDILHADIQGYEFEMLNDSTNSLRNNMIDYIFLSTHSQDLHADCRGFLRNIGYKILVSADFDHETTSYDGFLLAASPLIAQQISDHNYV